MPLRLKVAGRPKWLSWVLTVVLLVEAARIS